MLSSRHQDTCLFTRDYIARHSRTPLQEKIAKGLRIRSKGVVHRYIQALAEEGMASMCYPAARISIRCAVIAE